jgi:ribosomal protein L7/L12
VDHLIVGLAVFFSFITLIVVSMITKRMTHIERNINLLLRERNIDFTGATPVSERVRELATNPQTKIAAIKQYRDETGAGLAEAKAMVESIT